MWHCEFASAAASGSTQGTISRHAQLDLRVQQDSGRVAVACQNSTILIRRTKAATRIVNFAYEYLGAIVDKPEHRSAGRPSTTVAPFALVAL